jgi:Mycothiol maleylpyruvate isomerase N-terminal domain
MHVDHAIGRDAFVAELTSLLDLAAGLTDEELLATSHCRGWTVADVLTHVHLGLQEMLLGIVSPTDDPTTVDAASYWSAAPPSNDDEASPVEQVRFVRVLSAVYRHPTGGVRHLELTGRILGRAVARTVDEAHLDFQGHVIATGDFFATWAVELAVHHLDLTAELIMESPTTESLRLARQTVDELAGGPVPATLTDTDAVLIGTGRLAPPVGLDLTGLRMPALG